MKKIYRKYYYGLSYTISTNNDLNVVSKILNTGLYNFHSAKFHNVPRDEVFLEVVSTG